MTLNTKIVASIALTLQFIPSCELEVLKEKNYVKNISCGIASMVKKLNFANNLAHTQSHSPRNLKLCASFKLIKGK